MVNVIVFQIAYKTVFLQFSGNLEHSFDLYCCVLAIIVGMFYAK